MQLIQKMSRYTGNHVRKNYFTKSTSSLPSPHPKEEFLSIINAKKHYQSIIKQELNALEMIDNAETKEIISWQQQLCNKQTKVQQFVLKQSQYQMPLAIKKEEKMPKQLRDCYDQVRLRNIGRAFKAIVSNMKANRRRQMRRRAANYFYRQNTLKAHFKTWIIQTHQDPSIIAQLKIREEIVKNMLRKQYFQYFIKQRMLKQGTVSIKEKLLATTKRRFLGALAQLASYKYTQIIADSEVQKILKRVFFSHAKQFLFRLEAAQSLRQKQRLLENIYCHRRLNSFFNAYKQIKFKRQQGKITGSIINKIDLFKLVEQTEDHTLHQEDTTPEAQEANRRKIRIKTEQVNTGLLSLILQNFIDQYSQEYDYPLNEEEFHNFLHELKSQCVSRLVLNHGKKTVFKCLTFHKKVITLTDLVNSRYKLNTIEQLSLHRLMRQRQSTLVRSLLLKHFTIFSQETLKRKDLKQKLGGIQVSQLAVKLNKKLAIDKFYCLIAERRKLKFKKKVADNWRSAQLNKLVFNSWRSYNECQSQVTPYKQDQQNKKNSDIFDDYYQESGKPNLNLKQSGDNHGHMPSSQCKSEDHLMASNAVQSDEYGTSSRRSKAKQQLSKIVNIIGRGLPDKSSFYSSKKSSQSQSSNKPTVRLNTQSDHQQPIQSQEKLQTEKEMVSEQSTLLYIRLRKIRLAQTLRLMRQTKQLFNKIKKLNKMQIKRSLKQAKRNYLDKKNQKMNEISLEQNTLVKQRKRFLRNLRNDYAFFRYFDQLQSYLLQKNRVFIGKTLRKYISVLNQKKQLQQKQLKMNQLVRLKQKQLYTLFFCSLGNQLIHKCKKKQLESFLMSVSWTRVLDKLKLNLDQKQSQNAEIEHENNHKSVQKYNFVSPKQIQADNEGIRQVSREGHQILSDLLRSEESSRENLNRNEENAELQEDNNDQLNRSYQDSQSKSRESLNQREEQEIRNYLFQDNLESNSHQALELENSHMEETGPGPMCENKRQRSDEQEEDEEEDNKQLEGQAWLAYTIKQKLLQKQQIINQSSNLQQSLNLSPVNKSSSSPRPTTSIHREQSQNPQSQSQTSRSQSNPCTHPQQGQTSYEKEIQILIKMRKRIVIQRLIAGYEHLEQERIRKEEREGIVKFNLANKDKRLKAQAFEALYSVIEDRWSRKTMQICFGGWKLFSGQKKMLRQYLQMQKESAMANVSYYPQSVQEKKAFQQLRAS